MALKKKLALTLLRPYLIDNEFNPSNPNIIDYTFHKYLIRNHYTIINKQNSPTMHIAHVYTCTLHIQVCHD